MIERAIYKMGETNLQTTVDSQGRCSFTSWDNPTGEDYTVDEYLDKLGPGYVCIPFIEACRLIDAAMEAKYIKPWEEITEEQWSDWLEVLPPMRWQTVNGVNFFQVSEITCGDITQTCARWNRRYYGAMRHTSDDYGKLAEEVKSL